METFGSGIWDVILSVLVTFHVIIEFIHYAHEFNSARKEKAYLKDIHDYRTKSTKTEKLIQIQKDIDLIKEHVQIKEK